MSLRWLLLFVALLDCEAAVFSHSDEQVTAETGQTVTLPCGATKRNNIRAVQWSRADLETEGYVLFYRDGQFDSEQQHPSFKGWVQLKEGWKVDGDVSLILKNVMTEDSGTYECRVGQEGTKTELINTISLSVLLPGHSGGHKGGGDKEGGDKIRIRGAPDGAAGVLLAVIVAAAVVGFVIYARRQMLGGPPVLYEAAEQQV
ncbi:uncharacterized protein LOC114436592 [Parambassis ranga]|uniref:Uncharacterized protein LOC114436592 n=1 Tax=Parambassis ranga TaxID=210632 RepID=A0A6P7IPX7_9TELE|nr:uncharacterized protein LOC114436592 [Parambassis ranga]